MKKYFQYIVASAMMIGSLFSTTSAQTPTDHFYEELQKLNIPITTLLEKSDISRYELTRLLNAVECKDCIMPSPATRNLFNENFWNNFLTLPGKDFRDISYLSGYENNINYYYCVAKVGNDDIMRGYPIATSPICGGNFCGSRKVNKAEFFQTLVNLLTENIKENYIAGWAEIKSRLTKKSKSSYEYRVFTPQETKIIQEKTTATETIKSREEFSAYLKYCMFNTSRCNFSTFETL